ncbi:MAG TPA: hypothetical protein VFZ41_03990, partial [Solirubrobacterales bacterium]
VALSGLALVAAHLHGSLGVLLPVVPLLLLVVSLLFGFYPGCEAAMRLAERIASRARGVASAEIDALRPPLPECHAVHGGLLLAFSLSGRAPPRA